MLDKLNEIPLLLLRVPWTLELTGEVVAFALLLCFAGLVNLELRLPKIKRPAKHTRQSFQTNIGLFAFNSVLLSMCSATALYMVAEHYSGYGLLNSVTSLPLKALLAFLATDLLLYFWHVACHRFDFLWILHRVHHNDPYLNVSTAFRLHFVEVLATNALKALLIILFGIDKMLVLMIEALVTLSIMFHHANIGFKYEHVLSRFIIVPYLHRVHHSTERSEHDRNYGAMLSVWDKCFGTLLDVEPKYIGIKGESPQDLFKLIAFGFGVNLEKPVTAELPANLDVMIAEAAYYKAEKRSFRPGYDYRDWLEAKADILNQVSRTKSRRPNSFWSRVIVASMPKTTMVKLLRMQRILQQQSLKNLLNSNIQWR
jgi:sterol desaturase/sphingolipid hydroxylase (fatty acid hydroxylase superfamily)